MKMEQSRRVKYESITEITLQQLSKQNDIL